MNIILNEIENALSTNLYYLAIATTLSLPDICAALESPNGTTTKSQYVAWCDTWFNYSQLKSEDLYMMRCGVLHQGKLGHPNMTYDRVLFTLPNTNRNVFHRNIIDNALNLDAVLFCRDMMKSVANWYQVKQQDTNVVNNLPRLIQFRPMGLAPYMVGMPLIT